MQGVSRHRGRLQRPQPGVVSDASPHTAHQAPAGCAGERGAELRELLDQNPVVAIPVIMFRLQQKDREW